MSNEIVKKTNAIVKPEDILIKAAKLPMVKIDREMFLRKELLRNYPESQVQLAIDNNPAFAGIPRDVINDIADNVIKYETNKVSAISAAAGVPGGVAMFATVSADAIQYFGFLVRIMQKLAYLYGFKEFEFDENNVSDETMNTMLLCLGVMFSLEGANMGIKKIAESMATKAVRDITRISLTKGTVYPIVKQISKALGIKMTKQIFAKGVSKAIPVIAAVTSGGLTYVTFKNSSYKLQKEFKKLNISDPRFYLYNKY